MTVASIGGVTRWARRPWVLAVLVALLGVAVAAVVRFTPLFEISRVSVVGNEQVSADEVLAVAGVDDGTPLLTLPVETIEQRIETLDAVASAAVSRQWPDAVRIVVEERRAVGYVELGDAVGLVGSDGTVFRQDSEVPRAVPELVGVGAAVGESVTAETDAGAAAVFAVASTLPTGLQRHVERIEADDPRRVRLLLDDGVAVTWGSAGGAEQKSSVVMLLRERRGWGRDVTSVDVSAPDAPALAP